MILLALAGCAAPLPASAAEVRAVVGRQPDAAERLAWGVAPPTGGAFAQVAVFARSGRGWARYHPESTGEIVAAYRLPDGGRLILAWHTAGDAGQEWHGLLFDSGGTLLACPVLPFPDALNRDERKGERATLQEYVTVRKLAIDRGGRGTLVASGEIDVNSESRAVRFRYRTLDGGRSWQLVE